MPASDIAYTPILPEGWPRPRGFSHAVVATGTRSVRIAGQIGRAPNEAHIAAGTDAGTQWRQALANVVAVLKAAGSDLGHAVKTTVFLKSMDSFAAMNEVYGLPEYFGSSTPARSTVEVARLPRDVMVEIEVVALA